MSHYRLIVCAAPETNFLHSSCDVHSSITCKQEPSDLRLLASEYRRAGFSRVYDTFNSYRLYPLEEALRRIDIPALVVRGERDRLVPQGWAEEVARRLPRGRLVVVPGAAHTMSRFWPEELAESVTPFLREKS